VLMRHWLRHGVGIAVEVGVGIGITDNYCAGSVLAINRRRLGTVTIDTWIVIEIDKKVSNDFKCLYQITKEAFKPRYLRLVYPSLFQYVLLHRHHHLEHRVDRWYQQSILCASKDVFEVY
jgi:hypothetical protein